MLSGRYFPVSRVAFVFGWLPTPATLVVTTDLRDRIANPQPLLVSHSCTGEAAVMANTHMVQAQGGHFTTALVDGWKSGQSYAAWFSAAKRLTPKTQVPTCEVVGEFPCQSPRFSITHEISAFHPIRPRHRCGHPSCRQRLLGLRIATRRGWMVHAGGFAVTAVVPSLQYEPAPTDAPDRFRLTADTTFYWRDVPARFWDLASKPVETDSGCLQRTTNDQGPTRTAAPHPCWVSCLDIGGP